MKNKFLVWGLLILLPGFLWNGMVCAQAAHSSVSGARPSHHPSKNIICGADQTALYFHYLKGKQVGLVVNYTSAIGGKRSLDSMLLAGIHIAKVFGPEHGFLGLKSAATPVGNAKDSKTGIPVISLFGNHYKPTREELKGIDILVFDIQDVGVRFYTYLSTLHYVMEACAENNIELMLLDRPNPNDYYVDGPVLKPRFTSFIGVDPIPILHGVTFGEYAMMANGEGWLKNKEKCHLKVILIKNYRHGSYYQLPVPPSPNLRDQQAVLLYPSLCLFGGTVISDGRGTYFPFEFLGNPQFKGKYSFSFKPVPIKGMSENPPLKNQVCYGLNLRHYDLGIFRKTKRLNLAWMLEFYRDYSDKANFFKKESTGDSLKIGYHLDELAGTDELRKQIIAGKSEKEIRASWEPGLSEYKITRKKYLLYSDFY